MVGFVGLIYSFNRQNVGQNVVRRKRLCIRASSDREFQERFASTLYALQDRVCRGLEELDGGSSFEEDVWSRESGFGGGRTRVLEGGRLFEKAAANVSVVKGDISPERAAAMRSRGRSEVSDGSKYFAAALSIVFHSLSPKVPTLRGDVRVFQCFSDSPESAGTSTTWCGGGADLTPSYLFEEDVTEFHGFWKNICDKHDTSFYPKFKPWCDDYFYIPMRKEHRGVGGIFFDDLDFEQSGGDTKLEAFLSDVAEGWIPSITAIADRRRTMEYSDHERQWQLLRRGRYAEFNLVYDRGVRFGLLSNGRIESIMVSAPPLVAWKYNFTPADDSDEAALLAVLRKPREWV